MDNPIIIRYVILTMLQVLECSNSKDFWCIHANLYKLCELNAKKVCYHYHLKLFEDQRTDRQSQYKQFPVETCSTFQCKQSTDINTLVHTWKHIHVVTFWYLDNSP